MKGTLKKRFFYVTFAFVSVALILTLPSFVNAANKTTNIATSLPLANLSELTPTSTSPFSDLDLTTEQGKAMQKLVQLGVIKGYPDGTARPNETITREQAALILTLLTHKNPNLNFETNPFKDVSESSWAYNYILFSHDYGYMKGTSDQTFLPSGTLTRGQMAVILDNFFYLEESFRGFDFEDVNPTDYYYNAVSKLVENGITKGTSSTQFSPNAGVTRGQLAAFFDRSGLLDMLLELQNGIAWSDIPSGWVDGDHYDIYSYFGYHLNGYFEKHGLGDQYILIDYDYLGSDNPSHSFRADGIANGSIIPIPHGIYNDFLNTSTRFTVLVEVKNGAISRFKIEKPDEISANYQASTGLKELNKHIDYWKAIHYVGKEENDYIGLEAISDDLRYAIVEYDDSIHFSFPDEKSFYAMHTVHYGYEDYDFELLKIKPIKKANGYDITFEEATPSHVLPVTNKKKRTITNIYIEENYPATIGKTEGDTTYINLFGDANTNAPIKEGTSITAVIYETTDIYNELGEVIGYDLFQDFYTYVLSSGKWDLVFEHTETESVRNNE